VVLADSELGIRVINVEETSQAALADLRPEDIIVRVNETSLRSIDEFSTFSERLRGSAINATVLVIRNGQPVHLRVHLYSYPVLRRWGVSFLPEHDIRFADSQTGLAYWKRLGRGFETAGDFDKSLDAYLNGLHNDPEQLDVALTVSELLWHIAHRHLQAQRLAEALKALQDEMLILERLFNEPLSTEQLEQIKAQLEGTIRLLRTFQHGSSRASRQEIVLRRY